METDKELAGLLAEVRKLPPPTDEQKIEQQISWAWGNCAVDWPEPPPLSIDKFAVTVWRDKWREANKLSKALSRVLLDVEWGLPGDDGGDEAFCSACETHRVGRTPNAVNGHAHGCRLDAALTLAGFPDAASREAARAMMKKETK